MKNYKNLGGSSGITGYKDGKNFIDVEFQSGGVYRYTKDSVGEVHLSVMKALAVAGVGLNTYINANVRFKYAKHIGVVSEKVNVTVTEENAVAVVSELVKSGKRVQISVG